MSRCAVYAGVVRPRIGITTFHPTGTPRPGYAVPCGYVDAVQTAGGVPILLPPLRADPAEVLDAIDGLILPGGGDIDPACYDGTSHGEHYDVSPERDAFELALVRAALARPALPILCICRGMQVLNVALGGDVVAHLPDEIGESIPHRAPGLMPVGHAVRLEDGSTLHAIHDTTTLQVQSIHHQAVRRLAGGLTALAWSADGVVEAAELAANDFVVAVQWHPELDPSEAVTRRLFDALVDRSRRYAALPTPLRRDDGARRLA